MNKVRVLLAVACITSSLVACTTTAVIPTPKEGTAPAVFLSITPNTDIFFDTQVTLTATLEKTNLPAVIDHVEFIRYRNGVNTIIASDNSTPYSFSFPVSTQDNGAYIYSAKLYTAEGVIALSNTVNININIF